MNRYYYDILIKPFIKLDDRKILSKKDRWLIAIMRCKNDSFKMLLSNIFLHRGTPCDRYCICGYFRKYDIINCYDKYKKQTIFFE